MAVVLGRTGNVLLVVALAFAAVRTGKPTLGWLCLIGAASAVGFTLTRSRGSAVELWWADYWPLVLTAAAAICLLAAHAVRKRRAWQAFWEGLYMSGVLVLPTVAITGVALIEQLGLPQFVPAATFGCLTGVYLLAAWLDGVRGFIIAAARSRGGGRLFAGVVSMRAIVERVNEAGVSVDGQVVGAIGRGLLVYVGVGLDDTAEDAKYIREKIVGLRIFTDDAGKMNLSVGDVGGGLLVISAFALQADARKGCRPSFDAAAGLELAQSLYNLLCDELAATGLPVARGVFRAHMHVAAVNDGPIRILLDSKRLF